MERDELAIGDEQAEWCALVDDEGGLAVIGADSEKVAVALACSGLDESVADVIAETEGVVDVLPVGLAKDEGLAVLHLPLEQFGLNTPPGIEMDVFDASNVVDGVDKDSAP